MTIESAQQAFNLFEVSKKDQLEKIREIAVDLGRYSGLLTVDNVRDEYERSYPNDIISDNRLFGVVFKTKDWVHVGYTATKRQSSHHRPISLFKFVGNKNGTDRKS